MKGKYLITTDGWFFAPDGRQYKSVWGEVEILEDLIFAQLEGASSSIGYKGSSSSISYLDSPATTSATTYKLQAAKVLGSGIDFQGSNSNASTITLLEIGA